MFAYEKICEDIRYRLESGYYLLRRMPSVRKLAAEYAVSDFTIRKALAQLRIEGIIGSAEEEEVPRSGDSERLRASLRIGFLCPQWLGFSTGVWQRAFFRAVRAENAQFRTVPFYDWKDPVISDSVNAFDGCFLLSPSTPITTEAAETIRRGKHPAVLLQVDSSAMGIPCIRTVHPGATARLLDHLAGRGHRRIACLNTQPHDPVVEERLGQYRLWMLAHGMEPEILDYNPPTYSDPTPLAWELMAARLKKEPWTASALLSTTLPGALGAMRALRGAGVLAGRDIAVASVDGEGIEDYLEPGLTTGETADGEPFFRVCLRWMRQGGDWEGPLLLQPADAVVQVRASTDFSYT